MGMVVAEAEKNFSSWLEISRLTEQDFLDNRTVADFEILNGSQDKYQIIVIGYRHAGEFTRIGEQFAYPEGDQAAFQDLAFLLLYMAQKLDDANAHAPAFEQRPNYFYDKVKVFLKEQIGEREENYGKY